MFKYELNGNQLIIRLFACKSFKGIKISIRNPFSFLFNKIYLVDKNGKTKRVYKIKGLKILYFGSNSLVYVHKPIKFLGNCQIYLSSNCNINIGSYKNKIKNLDIRVEDNCVVDIKNNFSCGGCNIFVGANPAAKVTIGEDCMFSENILFMTSDGHKIFKKDDKEQTAINLDGDISIGNHVWIGRNVTILKNSSIPNHSIVGANSVVNKKFEDDNVIIAGVPAKKVKENTDWSQTF